MPILLISSLVPPAHTLSPSQWCNISQLFSNKIILKTIRITWRGPGEDYHYSSLRSCQRTCKYGPTPLGLGSTVYCLQLTSATARLVNQKLSMKTSLVIHIRFTVRIIEHQLLRNIIVSLQKYKILQKKQLELQSKQGKGI